MKTRIIVSVSTSPFKYQTRKKKEFLANVSRNFYIKKLVLLKTS